MIRIKSLWLTLLLSFVAQSCSDDDDIVRLTVASERMPAIEPVGLCTVLNLLAKKEGQSNWHIHDAIEGFQYEPGVEWVLDIRSTTIPDPPQDASSVRHTLIRIVSKESKRSENLPEGTVCR